jgi:hypothetical protein
VFSENEGSLGFRQAEELVKEEKAGRRLILFAASVFSSIVRHVWKIARLRDLISSSLEMVDELKPIRRVEHTNRGKVIAPFVGAQTDIREVFGFETPEGCAPTRESSRQSKLKWGRHRKLGLRLVYGTKKEKFTSL